MMTYLFDYDDKLSLYKLPLLKLGLTYNLIKPIALVIAILELNKINLTEVTSPTFNLVNEYDIGILNIKHYDLFRLTDNKELENIGLLEYHCIFGVMIQNRHIQTFDVTMRLWSSEQTI